MNPKIQYIFIGSFILGVASFSLFEFSFYYFLFFFAPFLFVRRKRNVVVVTVVVTAFLLGGFRIALVDLENNQNILDEFVSSEVQFEGIIISEPDVRERYTRLTILLSEVDVKVIALTERFPEFYYGDKVQVVGILEKPENFESEGGREFNYISYLAKDDIFYTVFFPEITFISSGQGNPIKTGLFYIKQKWLHKIQELIPDPHAALLGGLVVGAKESLGEELEEDFRKTGIIHIVVLSGYNVTIVAEAFMRVFSFLPAFASLSLGAFSIILFAILTGASATIVRASIMALLVLLARATGRTSEMTHALFLAGFFMVLHNPMIVLYDPSFQLSFLATIGLIYVAPRIEKYFHLMPTKFQLREFAVATVSTQLFVLPLLLYMMGEISLVALPVNILVLAFIPVTMLFGFLTGVSGFMSSVFAFPFAVVSYVLLSYELFIVDMFARFPFASISVPHFSLWVMILLYSLFGYLLVIKKAP